MEARVGFRAQVRFHLNFWARSRRTSKIKRFFAEERPKTNSHRRNMHHHWYVYKCWLSF
jgi:hypothetical protein